MTAPCTTFKIVDIRVIDYQYSVIVDKVIMCHIYNVNISLHVISHCDKETQFGCSQRDTLRLHVLNVVLVYVHIL